MRRYKIFVLPQAEGQQLEQALRDHQPEGKLHSPSHRPGIHGVVSVEDILGSNGSSSTVWVTKQLWEKIIIIAQMKNDVQIFRECCFFGRGSLRL